MSKAAMTALPYPSEFKPTSVPGCKIWMDAADITSFTFSSGSNISLWKDKSGFGNNFTTINGTNTLISDGGYSVVSFPSGAVMSSANQVNLTTTSALFIISKLTSTAGRYLLAFTNIDIGAGAGDFSIRLYQGILQGIVTVPLYGNVGDIGNANYYVNGFFNPSLTSTAFLNTYSLIGTVASLQSGSTYITLSTTIYSPSVFYIGNIAEFIFYPDGVTSTQRQQVEGYLTWKWGLQAKLPGNHPHLAAPPLTPNALGITRPPAVTALVPTVKRAMTSLSYNAAFLPTSISGCAMWLDAADSASFTFSSGTTISQWNDKSGSANNFTVTTGTTTRITDGGFNVVNFPSSGSTMTSSSNITLTTNHSVFIVTKLISNTFGLGYLLSCASLKPSDNPQGLSGDYSIRYNPSLITPSTGNGGDIFFNNTGGYYANGTLSGVPTSTSYHMLNGRFSQGGTTQIALSFGGVYGRYFVGTVAEVIIFSQVLTTNQRQQIEGYLAWKWGLQARLPSFVPTSLTNCQIWLDASDSSTITMNGSTVASWRDKTGNGFNVSQSTTASQPTVGTNSIVFNGSTSLQYSGSVGIFGSSYTSYVVHTCTNNADYRQGIISIKDSTTGFDFEIGQFYVWVSGGSIYHQFSSSVNSITMLGITSTTSLGLNYSINGQPFTGGGAGWTSVSSGSSLLIGNSQYSGVGYIGTLNEYLLFTRTLTTTEHNQVTGYLAWKWGLQANLPGAHPNYSSSPIHSYSAAAPVGASLRAPAVAALIPNPAKGVTAIKKPIPFLTLTNSGSTDSYIASYLSNGYVNSIARQAGTGADVGNGIAIDTNGNIIITGHYSSNPFTFYTSSGSAFSTTLVNSGQTAFVAQYSSTGAVNWVARFSGSSVGLFCKTDSSNNIYVFGYFNSGPLTAYSSTGTAFGTTISTLYYFLVKYNSAGIIQWIANIGGTGQTNQNSLTCDTNGNVIVTCTGGGITPLNSNGTSYTGSGILGAYRVNGFIVYYNTSGTIQWVASFAGGSRFWNQAISVDSSGNVYCSGYSLGSFAQVYNASGTGGFTIAGASGQNGYIAKYTSAGSNVSGTAYGGSGVTAAPLSQVTDSNANTTIVGTFTGTTFIAYSNNTTSQPFSNTLSNPGTTCGFIVQYNSSFVVQWTANIQAATGAATPTGVTCDASNNIYVSVFTTGNVTIYSSNGAAATTITNTGTNTSFIVKFSSTGLFIWAARQSGGASTSQYLYGIATDSTGNPYAVGAYTSAAGLVYTSGL
jgi:hypothetical protein